MVLWIAAMLSCGLVPWAFAESEVRPNPAVEVSAVFIHAWVEADSVRIECTYAMRNPGDSAVIRLPFRPGDDAPPDRRHPHADRPLPGRVCAVAWGIGEDTPRVGAGTPRSIGSCANASEHRSQEPKGVARFRGVILLETE